MMFDFKRDGKTVTCRVDTDLPHVPDGSTTTGLGFKFAFDEACVAELTYRYLENRYKEAVRSLIKKAYDAGWNDHRQKKRKRQNFSCDLLQKYGDL